MWIDFFDPAHYCQIMMMGDIREKSIVTSGDVLGLNFIRNPMNYVLRRHFRQGLRSHIMEVIDPGDAKNEKKGIEIDGVMRFPRAIPLKMLRIFRAKFPSPNHAFKEIHQFKIIEKYLKPSFYAESLEFLVDYTVSGKRNIILCGLQEYVEGMMIEPWGMIDPKNLAKELINRGYASEKKNR